MNFPDLFGGENPKCEGCPVLSKNLIAHSIMDYEYEEECDILFLSDSPKMHEGSFQPFRPPESRLIVDELLKNNLPSDIRVEFSTAVKCPNMSMDVMTAKARKICRQHLIDTIKHYKPKLVLACGKLATTMVYGKSKLDAKTRGKIVDMVFDDFECRVVSIIHPWQVVSEPKNAYLFSKDIENILNQEIHKTNKPCPIDYSLVMSEEETLKFKHWESTDKPIAVDIETTGLNFLTDFIHTVSLSLMVNGKVETIVIPIDHKDSKLGWLTKARLIDFIQRVLRNRANRKVFQNATFDLKFLHRYGVVDVYNVWDTKLMQHLYNEEVPKSLSDLVYYYFPDEI